MKSSRGIGLPLLPLYGRNLCVSSWNGARFLRAGCFYCQRSFHWWKFCRGAVLFLVMCGGLPNLGSLRVPPWHPMFAPWRWCCRKITLSLRSFLLLCLQVGMPAAAGDSHQRSRDLYFLALICVDGKKIESNEVPTCGICDCTVELEQQTA